MAELSVISATASAHFSFAPPLTFVC